MSWKRAIEPLRDRVILSHGWQRLLIAGASGLLSAAAAPPFFLFPVLAVTFTVLVWLIDSLGDLRGRQALRSAFAIGWAFGFGYFLAGLWWIGSAFLVESDVFGWLLPLAVTGLPALLAMFTGFGVLAARLLWSPSPARAAALTAGLGLAEYLRGHIFTGFPWNSFGYALTGTQAQMQAASLIGTDGLTLIAIFAGAAPAIWLGRDIKGNILKTPVIGLAILLLAAPSFFGEWRLLTAESQTVPGVRLRLVQPNLTQAERLDRTRHLDVLERYLRLSRGNADAPPPTHVIWPESALPFRLGDGPQALSRITGMLAPGSVLILGMLRADDLDQRHVLNSLFVLDDKARVLDRYDKTHLVPFGEYLPLPNILSAIGLEPLTRIFAFVPGQDHGPVIAGKAPSFTALICYEAIFASEVAARPRAAWIINISDDSWFGDTPGPRQHFHQARLRAVEEGLPLARVTTTGLTALIDPYGRIINHLDLEREGAIDAALPQALPPTLYALMRDKCFWALWLLFVTFSLITRIGLFSRRDNF